MTIRKLAAPALLTLALLSGCTLSTPVTTGTVTPPSAASPAPSSTGSRIPESWDTTTFTPRPESSAIASEDSKRSSEASASDDGPSSTAPEDLDRPTTSGNPSTSTSFTVDTAPVVVERASDGDTIHVLVDGADYGVRIIGIDTPETVDPRKPIQCFGPQSSDRTKDALTGEMVVLTPDPTQGDKDKFGRLLRYVNLPDGTDWGAQLIKEGLAREYKYDKVYQRRATYLGLQDEARRNGTGGWGPAGGGGCGWQ
jgi:micrococcal nuclease